MKIKNQATIIKQNLNISCTRMNNTLLMISLKKEQSCKRLEVTAHQIYAGLHTYIPWIHNCVIKTSGCGTSHKYTHIQIYSV